MKKIHHKHIFSQNFASFSIIWLDFCKESNRITNILYKYKSLNFSFCHFALSHAHFFKFFCYSEFQYSLCSFSYLRFFFSLTEILFYCFEFDCAGFSYFLLFSTRWTKKYPLCLTGYYTSIRVKFKKCF